MDYPADTMQALLRAGGDNAPAIGAPGRAPLTHAGLRAQADATVASLNAMGIGRGDRVAIVLPNGPEMASAFVCVAAASVTAPLNPAYKPDELDFTLSDLRPRAMLVLRGAETPAREATARAGVPLVELVPGELAGSFTLEPAAPPAGGAARPGPGRRSLTTSRWCCTPRAPRRGPRSCR